MGEDIFENRAKYTWDAVLETKMGRELPSTAGYCRVGSKDEEGQNHKNQSRAVESPYNQTGLHTD